MYNIDTGRNGREGGGTVHASRDGGGIIAGDGLNGKHRAGNRFAAYSVPLGDLHIGQRMVFGGHGVLLVAIGGIDIDADGRRVGTVALRGLGFHEGPQATGDILDFDNTAVFSHIAADDLAVAVNVEFRAIQTLGRSCGNLLQGNVGIAGRRIIRIRLWRVDSKFPWRIIIKKRLVLAIA